MQHTAQDSVIHKLLRGQVDVQFEKQWEMVPAKEFVV
jgi:hypothetical protein